MDLADWQTWWKWRGARELRRILMDEWDPIGVRGDKREGSQAPKSAAGTRTVPVCEQLYDVLDEHLLRLGRSSGLIFGRSEALPFSYSGHRDRAGRAHEDAGLEPADLQLHECRHSFKTFLEDAGIRESRVDRYMGHADHSVPGRYSHQSEAKYLEDAQALCSRSLLSSALHATRRPSRSKLSTGSWPA
jgi:integrase